MCADQHTVEAKHTRVSQLFQYSSSASVRGNVSTCAQLPDELPPRFARTLCVRRLCFQQFNMPEQLRRLSTDVMILVLFAYPFSKVPVVAVVTFAPREEAFLSHQAFDLGLVQ